MSLNVENINLFNQILNESIYLFLFGSHIYGTNRPDSDLDYICVVANDSKLPDHINLGSMDFNIYKEDQWAAKKIKHDIDYLECVMNPDCIAIANRDVEPLTLDYDKVRESVSHISSNSFVKAKKKLIIEKDFDPYIGKKSLWHCLRILMFGIQIMKEGKIVDYKAANYLYDEIVNNPSNDWEEYKAKYQPLYNKLHSEFKLAHKARMEAN